MIIAAGPFPSGGGLWAPPPDPRVGFAPLLDPDAGGERSTGSPLEGVRADREADLFWHAPATGVHEPLEGALTLSQTLQQWRERIRERSSAAWVHVASTRAMLPAAELVALPFVPAGIARERERFGAYAVRTMGGNLLGDLIQEEVRKRERIVAIDAEGVLICPFASRAPYQLLLAPRTPRARFEDDGPVCAALLEDALARLARCIGPDVPVQLWVRTAPRDAEHFAWRIDIMPAGLAPGLLEAGAGIPGNPLAPEAAAAQLRG